jgi:hypothetical protein
MCAVLVGLLGLTSVRRRDLAAQDHLLAEWFRLWPLLPIKEVERLTAGVFPSRPDLGPYAAYVSRDVDAEIDDALRQGGITLIIGDARSGKTRSAYEAARRVLGNRLALIPVDGQALRAILNHPNLIVPEDAVWWLDDLERFLTHLNANDLSVLLDERHAVLATMREEAWQNLLCASGDDGERGRRLRAAARLVRIAGRPSAAELTAAAGVYPQLDVSNGIGRVLAASGSEPRLPQASWRSDAKVRRVDVVLGISVAASLGALLALLAIVSTGGFTKAATPTIGAQIDSIREQASRTGYTTRLTLGPQQLHGSEQRSVGFLLSHENAQAVHSRGSDEFRIYDEVDGHLQLELSFQPAKTTCRGLYLPTNADSHHLCSFERVTDYVMPDRPIVKDLNGDGAREIIVGYAPRWNQRAGPSDVRYLRLPVIIGWDDGSRAYVVSGLPSSRTAMESPQLQRMERQQHRYAPHIRESFVLTDADGMRSRRVRVNTIFFICAIRRWCVCDHNRVSSTC